MASKSILLGDWILLEESLPHVRPAGRLPLLVDFFFSKYIYIQEIVYR